MATTNARPILKVSARKAIDTIREGKQYGVMCIVTEGSSEDVEELASALVSQPNAFAGLYIDKRPVSDKAGAELGRYLASTTSLDELHMVETGVSEKTYLAVAQALHINTSLETIIIKDAIESSDTIDAAFAKALRVNPNRVQCSFWSLYRTISQDYERLLDQQ